jgi:DNA-binding XRE family transcriptional regulator
MKAKPSPMVPRHARREGGPLPQGPKKAQSRTARKGGGDALRPEKKPRLRVPKLKEGEGILGLLPEEEAFIQNMTAQRTLLGWSQDMLANMADVDRSTVQNCEHRRRAPSLRAAVKIGHALADALGRTCEWAESLLRPHLLLLWHLSEQTASFPVPV